MAKKTKAELKAKVDSFIKANGNRQITPEKHNSIETDEIDSFVIAADGGFIVDQALGYSSEVDITDDRQFASKKYVDDTAGGGSFSSITGDPYDNTALGAALDEKQDTLVSGDNIKTINSTSLLGSGDLSLPDPTSSNQVSNKNYTDNTAIAMAIALG